ncbi:MAG TPA: serine hydrolase domain-containing protein [Streptosporangiaceae bacterium]|nr:serine hydrolase domain-containing protein [Streptosporangiaceae bacterium]
MTKSDATAYWTARLTELAAAGQVPGAVLGIWADGQQTLACAGVLSTVTGVPVTSDSVFQLGSITKPWTATMIMQLAEEGKLSLDSTVAQLLPGLKVGVTDVSEVVTIRQLLTHTSGIDGDIFTDTGRGDDCIERYMALLADAGLTYPPGAAYSYSNSGFVLLGRIIEVLDGRVWDESLRQRLIGPLGLASTVTLPEEAILRRAAVGHREHPRELDPVSSWMLARALGPAGLITASAADVLAFARMHLDGGIGGDGVRVLSEDSAAAMRQPQARIPTAGHAADWVGLPWRLRQWGDRQLFGHDGSTIGQTAYLRIEPDSGIAVCLLTNAADSQNLYRAVFSEVFGELLGVTPPADPEPVSGPAGADYSRHAGRYERVSRRYDIFGRASGLRAVFETTGQLAALRESQTEELDLYPSDASGENFVCRSHDAEPWTSVSFGTLADGTAYLYSGGRVTRRTGDVTGVA